MASSPFPKLAFLLLFILSTLLFQTHARDSQFFSKVSRNRDSSTSSITNNHEVSLNNLKEEEEKEKEKEPTFLPQTTQTEYGLYGHETGLDPPSLSSSSSTYDDHMEKKNYASELKGLSVNGFTDNEPSTTSKNNGVEMYYANQDAPSTARVEKQGIAANQNENYYKENEGTGYYGGVQKQRMSAKYNNYYKAEDEGAGYFGGVQKQGMSAEVNKYYKEDQVGAGYYAGEEKQGMTAKNNYRQNEGAGYYGGVKIQGMSAKNNYRQNEGAGYYGGVEKQGMSDTRFLENGKYFHDINSEKKYDANPNPNYVHYNGNNYNSNDANNYDNYEEYSNSNKFNNGNSMQRYQNQEQEEEEFDFDP